MDNADVWVSRRGSVDDAWGTPEPVPEVSSPREETTPGVSGDGLTLWLATNRAGCVEGMDIWVSTRSSRTDPWSAPTCVPELSSSGSDIGPGPTATPLEMVVTSDCDTSTFGRLFLSRRSSTAGAWEAPVLIAGVSSSYNDGDARLVAGGLELYLTSNRDSVGGGGIYLAPRSVPTDAFSSVVPIDELNSPQIDSDPWISEDRRYIVFTSSRSGNSELYEASR